MIKKKQKKLSLQKLMQAKINASKKQEHAFTVFYVIAIVALGWIVIRTVPDMYITYKITQVRSHSEPTYDNKRAQQIDALHTAGAITSTSPLHSSKIDVCYVAHESAGWASIYWYQDCYIRYTDLFQVTQSRNDAIQQLKEANVDPALFGKLNTFQPKTCDALYKDKHKPTLIYLDLTVKPRDKGIDCNEPKPIQDFSSVRGPIILDKNLTINTERSYDTASIDKSKKYIVLQSDNYYYREPLGCGFGFSCPSPRKEPITGF